jgi:hypothetical protein
LFVVFGDEWPGCFCISLVLTPKRIPLDPRPRRGDNWLWRLFCKSELALNSILFQFAANANFDCDQGGSGDPSAPGYIGLSTIRKQKKLSHIYWSDNHRTSQSNHPHPQELGAWGFRWVLDFEQPVCQSAGFPLFCQFREKLKVLLNPRIRRFRASPVPALCGVLRGLWPNFRRRLIEKDDRA